VARRLFLVTALIAGGLVPCCSTTNYVHVDERSIEDRIVFTVIEPAESLPIPSAEILMIGSDWASRVDFTSDSGTWSISRAWLEGASKLVFCWPDGRFDCSIVPLDDIAALPAEITIVLPPPVFSHRSIYIPESQEAKDRTA